MHKRYPTVTLFSFCLCLAFASVFASPAEAAYSCGHDFNNDGELTQKGEIADCVLTDTGEPFCSLAPAECLVVQKDPSCPSGTSLNIETHRCEAEPTCTSGSYDRNSKTCILVTAAACPDGSTLNGTSDKCQAAPACNSGTYDPKQDMCIETSDRACPNGTIMNSSTGKCEAEPVCRQGTYNATYNACVYTGTGDPDCPADSLLNTIADRCEASPVCSTGTYDSTSNMCINSVTTVDATCPQGTVNNLIRDVCEGNGTCIANTAFDSKNKLCTAGPACQTGMGSYNASLNQCLTPGSAELLNSVGVTICGPWRVRMRSKHKPNRRRRYLYAPGEA